MRVLIVEDEPYRAIRDGLRPEAIAADIAGDGDAALALRYRVDEGARAAGDGGDGG